MELRGFDDYEVTLGDEMRGQRATLGRTLLDAESDLRIKANVLRAIEDCDLDGFPNPSVIAGYVRSYARYLQMDPDESYRRFCAESGYRSPVAELGRPRTTPDGSPAAAVTGSFAAGADLVRSRFAMRPAPSRLGARISLSGVVSALTLVALVGGLGYGGYALLQDIQRVGFAPLPEAPDIIAEAPLIAPPEIDAGLAQAPDAEAYAGGGALAAVVAPEAPPPLLAGRDGPISAIDPATSGLFVSAPPPVDEPVWAEDESAATADEGPAGGAAMAALAALPTEAVPAADPPAPPRIEIHATGAAWIRIREGEGTIFEGTLPAGGSFSLPARLKSPELRTGNAGAVYLRVGEAVYGPVGAPGSVVSGLSLRLDDIETALPTASASAIRPADEEPVERAAADLVQ